MKLLCLWMPEIQGTCGFQVAGLWPETLSSVTYMWDLTLELVLRTISTQDDR